MAYFLQLAIDIQRRPYPERQALIAALPAQARDIVAAWLDAHPTASGLPAGWVDRQARDRRRWREGKGRRVGGVKGPGNFKK